VEESLPAKRSSLRFDSEAHEKETWSEIVGSASKRLLVVLVIVGEGGGCSFVADSGSADGDGSAVVGRFAAQRTVGSGNPSPPYLWE
jgi:hypothetical protein